MDKADNVHIEAFSVDEKLQASAIHANPDAGLSEEERQRFVSYDCCGVASTQ